MKKLLALLMVVVMLFSLVACGSTANDENKDNSTQANDTSENSDTIQVDEGLFTVDVVMPASFFEGLTKAEIKAQANEMGYISCTVNEDGSVAYTMTKAKHREILDKLRASMVETIDGLINGANKAASFISIDYTDDFSQADIYVDASIYSMWDSMYALNFYISGAYYQSFAGVSANEIDVIVNFIDNATKEVLDTASYKEYKNSMSEAGGTQ